MLGAEEGAAEGAGDPDGLGVGTAVLGAPVGEAVGSGDVEGPGVIVGEALGLTLVVVVDVVDVVGAPLGAGVAVRDPHRHAIERKRAATVDLCTDAGGISAVGHVNGVVWAAAPAARVMRMRKERIVQ